MVPGHRPWRNPDVSESIEAVDFYWRQGCGFCMALSRGLNKAGIPMNKKNIWEDPNHADTVRAVANGSETVPTVVVGSTALVNPRVGQVIEALKVEAPHLVPEGADEPGSLSRFAHKLFGS
ncbi:MAG: glutaredoxin family protein [Acidimicrobiales bacterium]